MKITNKKKWEDHHYFYQIRHPHGLVEQATNMKNVLREDGYHCARFLNTKYPLFPDLIEGITITVENK